MAIMRNLITVLLVVATSYDLRASEPVDTLRQWYASKQVDWPKAITADGRKPIRLGPLLPKGPQANEEIIALGKSLFHDPILSKDNTVSCASCHDSSTFFQDGKGQSVGVRAQKGTRNAPPIFGVDHWKSFFWDGRAASAEEQALMPIENPIEMDLPVAKAVERLNSHTAYPVNFKQAFGIDTIDKTLLASALVAFERTIPAPDTPYQEFITAVSKGDTNAHLMLPDKALLGLHLFRTKAKCMSCHEGPLLSDNQFHVTGFHLYGRPFEDVGRIDATGKIEDIGKFRTPSLLGVTHTAPWMHNGLFIEFTPLIMQYNKGGFRPKPKGRLKDDPHFPITTSLIEPLGLDKDEIDALVVFLKTL